MKITDGEYGWVHLNWFRDNNIAEAWKLVCGPTDPTSYGFLLRGKAGRGWVISNDVLGFQPIATLPKTLSAANAQSAAKLMLLAREVV
jgi:hypothetical protein